MSYEPSFSKRPGGVAARPRFLSLLGLGADANDSGPPALKVIIDDESNPSSSRNTESAVSLLRTLDSAGDQGVSMDLPFPPKPSTPNQKQHVVSPVPQKFGRRAAVDYKSKGAMHICCFIFDSTLGLEFAHIFSQHSLLPSPINRRILFQARRPISPPNALLRRTILRHSHARLRNQAPRAML
jgi:hypothetical protein